MTVGLLRAYVADALDFVLNRPRFEVFEVLPHGLPPYWRWRLVQRGRVIAESHAAIHFANEAAARFAITVMKGEASNAQIDEELIT